MSGVLHTNAGPSNYFMWTYFLPEMCCTGVGPLESMSYLQTEATNAARRVRRTKQQAHIVSP